MAHGATAAEVALLRFRLLEERRSTWWLLDLQMPDIGRLRIAIESSSIGRD